MKRGIAYTLIFMLVVSSVFTFLLAGADTLLQPRIQENARVDEQKSILDAFGLDNEGEPEEISLRFETLVQPAAGDGFDYYLHVNEAGEVQGIAVPFSGAGLWGTIYGWMAVSPEKDTIQGLVFTEQNETPGLGGRIQEEWYREQFRGVLLASDQPISYGPHEAGSLDAITGATQTSNAIIRIVNNVKNNILPAVEVN